MPSLHLIIINHRFPWVRLLKMVVVGKVKVLNLFPLVLPQTAPLLFFSLHPEHLVTAAMPVK